MASGACCAAGAPVVQDYEPQGAFTTIAELNTYVVGGGPRCILVAADIFGFEFKQVFQVCDRLAAAGFRVAAPDMFKGAPWPESEFPPPDGAKFMAWLNSVCDLDATAGMLNAVKAHLLELEPASVFGTVGFCAGSLASFNLASDSGYKGHACCHPTFVKYEEQFANAAVNPVAIIAAKGDPMEVAKAILDQKPFAEQCFYQRMDDQAHGFMGARGDWSDATVAAAAGQGIQLVVDFFNKVMA